MNFTSADKVCSSVCPALCAFAMSASGIRKSLDSSLDLRVTHWKALHLYAEFLGFTVFSHHSTRSSMDRACSPVRLCARLWRQNSLWGLPNTGGNAFYVTSAVSTTRNWRRILNPCCLPLSTFKKFRMFLHNQSTTGASGHAQRSRAAEWLPSINSLWEFRAYLRPHFLYLRLILTYYIDIIIGWNLFCWLVSSKCLLKSDLHKPDSSSVYCTYILE